MLDYAATSGPVGGQKTVAPRKAIFEYYKEEHHACSSLTDTRTLLEVVSQSEFLFFKPFLTTSRHLPSQLMAQRLAARFIISAARPDQFPAETLPGSTVATAPAEIAFLGRSNVGKSSLLNALADVGGANADGKKLAFVSQRPGCTQVINFFQMGSEMTFVDLPGYGYAKVPVAIKKEWKGLIESYLVNRASLRLCVLLLDARRGWMDKDLELKQWLESRDRRYLVVATKMDKLTQRELHQAVTAIRAQADGVEIMPISATNGRGVRELWQTIWKIHNQ